MNRDELRRIVEAAGRDEVPPAHPDFVDDLERRLARTHVVGGRERRARWQAISAVAAAAAVIVALIVVQSDPPADTVVTDDVETTTTTSTSSTTTVTTSTTVTAPNTTVVVTTTATVAPPVTTTTMAPTTTAPPPPPETTTSTTATPGVEDMRMACTTGPRPEVTCTWSENTAEAFKGYILYRQVGAEPRQELTRTTDRSFTSKTDKDVVAGTRITYTVEALDRDSVVIGRGEATVSCC